jgi:hypothetical protein
MEIIIKKLNMKTKKLKTKKQIKKETIDLYEKFINELNDEFKSLEESAKFGIKYFKNLSKKEWKFYIKEGRMRECEEILEKNGIKIDLDVENELTLKELSSYKKKAKKVKFSSDENKAIKKYFRKKRKETEESIKLSIKLTEQLKKIGITLEELDKMPVIQQEDVKDVVNICDILDTLGVDKANENLDVEVKSDEVKVEEVKDEKIISEEV